MRKYKIYHIPDFVYPSGHIGKFGMTKQNVKSRIKQLERKYNQVIGFWEVFEEYDDKYTASVRERQLQVQYGYFQDTNKYHEMDYSSAGSKGGGWSKGKSNPKVSDALKGMKRSEESRRKQGETLKASGSTRGENSYVAVLDESKVKWIRAQYKRGKDVLGKPISQSRIGRALGRPQSTISAVLNGYNWSHI
jgi:hypothetical protein